MKLLLTLTTLSFSLLTFANVSDEELNIISQWMASPTVRTITFNNDIKPIIKKKCKICHNSSRLGKFMHYDQAYAKRELILKRVYVKRDMPKFGKLSNAQRQLFADWVAGGAIE